VRTHNNNSLPLALTAVNSLSIQLKDRLYLGSYTHAPNAHTPFPYPQKQPTRSPAKRSSRAQMSTGPKVFPPVYFSIDKQLVYNAFHADFGPLHIGHLYRFAVTLHEVLADPANTDRGVVFWSEADSRSKMIEYIQRCACANRV
jgi:cell division cycle 14